MTEYIFGQAFDHLPAAQPWKWLLQYVALAVGIGMAFFYRLDLIALLSEVVEYPIPASWLGFLLSGLGIGRGANFLHQFVANYFPKPLAD